MVQLIKMRERHRITDLVILLLLTALLSANRARTDEDGPVTEDPLNGTDTDHEGSGDDGQSDPGFRIPNPRPQHRLPHPREPEKKLPKIPPETDPSIRRPGEQPEIGMRTSGVPCKGSGMVIEGTSGTIHLPNLPNKRVAGCYWTLHVPPEQVIELTVSYKTRENDVFGMRCYRGRLTVFDGPSKESPMVASICPNDDKQFIRSTSNTLTLIYRSIVRYTSNRKIFTAAFWAAENVPKPRTNTPSCGQQLKLPKTLYRSSDTDKDDSKIHNKVVSVPTPQTRQPWAVGIYRNQDSLLCSGALLDPYHVTTAASCLHNRGSVAEATKLTVRAGDHDKRYEDIRVKTVTIHPNFTQGERTDDLAVLQLENHVEIGKLANSVCLASRPAQIDQLCTTTAYNLTASTWLEEIDLYITRHKICLYASPIYTQELTRQMLCADNRFGKGRCMGDVGSPLVCRYGDTYYLHGITSWGFQCGSTGRPTVFTDVFHYRDWLSQFLRG